MAFAVGSFSSDLAVFLYYCKVNIFWVFWQGLQHREWGKNLIAYNKECVEDSDSTFLWGTSGDGHFDIW